MWGRAEVSEGDAVQLLVLRVVDGEFSSDYDFDECMIRVRRAQSVVYLSRPSRHTKSTLLLHCSSPTCRNSTPSPKYSASFQAFIIAPS